MSVTAPQRNASSDSALPGENSTIAEDSVATVVRTGRGMSGIFRTHSR